MTDFILFNSGLDDAKYSAKVEGRNDEAASKLMTSASTIAQQKMFDYAPLDLKAIEAAATPVSSISELVSLLKQTKPSQLEESLRKAVLPIERKEGFELTKLKADPVEFALAYWMHCLTGKIFPKKLPSGECKEKEVRFAANYFGWTMVKKVNLAKAERKEILASLVGLNASLLPKEAEFASTDFDALTDALDAAALSAFPERKSFSKLPLVIEAVENAWNAISQYAKNPGVVKEYAFDKACERCGFPPFISIDSINGVYPELKIPKPKGNFGKRKK